MSKRFKRALFIFRRDLRLHDNSALNMALEFSEIVTPIFIFDVRQISEKNPYFSAPAFQFMISSLQDLDAQLRQKKSRISCFFGIAEKVVEQLFESVDFDVMFINKDYTPFSIKRDEALEHLCVRHEKSFFSCDDALLNAPTEILKSDRSPYAVFTPYFKAASKKVPQLPKKSRVGKFLALSNNDALSLDQALKKLEVRTDSFVGGRSAGLTILKDISDFSRYAVTHDIPSIPTTHLSAHLKFGTISAREAYHAIAEKLGLGHPLIRQLYWRDFFTSVAYHSPFVFGHAFRQKFDTIPWKNDKRLFRLWCEGKTGFPIVDAGMRELNTTGFMHNRVRMITASFLVKNLHIDWRWGEKYFAQHLVDYDPAVNNGNWQWVASTGCDAQPYFRIFNPWLQQKKFDFECEYIKKWVPELENVSPARIHSWYKEVEEVSVNYPRPILDFKQSSQATKAMFRGL